MVRPPTRAETFFSSWQRPAQSLIAGALMIAAIPCSVSAVTYYFAIDIPSVLGGATYTPAQILNSDNGVYSIVLDTQGGVFKAIHRRPDGLWLISEATPDRINGVFYEPRDIFLTDASTTFSMYFDGSAARVPEGVGIDAIFLDASGALVLSFDLPVNLGGMEYGPSDLVRYSGGAFSLFWSATAAGVPSYANVVGADRDSAGLLVLTFDVPTNLGGTDYLPGQLVAWNGGTNFSLYRADPAWPLSAQLRGFSFVPSSGAVPDGAGGVGIPLTVIERAGNLTLSWGSSCAAGDTDFEIYEGTLGAYYSHTQKFCTTGGATTLTFPEPPGSTYYLVVPKNAVSEGSYGRASSGVEIPQGTSACAPQQIALSCP
jgi:hypothetical protein